MEYDPEQHSSSFRHTMKSSFCFINTSDSYHVISSVDRPKQSPTTWIRSRAHGLPGEIKVKSWSLLSRIGRVNRRASNSTGEFQYDPMSYALNFQDELSVGNFLDRLPTSPTRDISV